MRRCSLPMISCMFLVYDVLTSQLCFLLGIYSWVYPDMQDCWIQKAIYLFDGWHYNGIWPWSFWTWALPCDNRGTNSKILNLHFFASRCLAWFVIVYFCHSFPEDGPGNARKWNRLVSRCRVFIYSSSYPWQRVCWCVSWYDWEKDLHTFWCNVCGSWDTLCTIWKASFTQRSLSVSWHVSISSYGSTKIETFLLISFHSKEWPAFMNFPIFLSRKRLCVHRSSIGASVFLFVKKAFVLVIQFQGSSSRHPSNFIRIQHRSWLCSLPQNDVASNRNSL